MSAEIYQKHEGANKLATMTSTTICDQHKNNPSLFAYPSPFAYLAGGRPKSASSSPSCVPSMALVVVAGQGPLHSGFLLKGKNHKNYERSAMIATHVKVSRTMWWYTLQSDMQNLFRSSTWRYRNIVPV